MLDALRGKRQSILTWAFFLMIAFLFVINFGPGSFSLGGLGAELTYAARVNDREITPSDFEMAYNGAYQRAKSQAQGNYNQESAQKARLRDTVMDQLVETELMAQEAEKLGLTLGDDALHDFIMTQPAFFENGKFSYERYSQLVKFYYRASPARFEERQRRELLANMVERMVTDGLAMSEAEVKEAFIQREDKVTLDVIELSLAKFEKVAPPDTRKFAELTEDEKKKVQAFYDKKKFEYSAPEKVRASQLLFIAGDDANSTEKDIAKKAATEALAQLKAGMDFAEAVKKYSQDPVSKAKDGELGFLARGDRAKVITDALFNLKNGETTDIIESPLGYHILKRTGYEPAKTREFDDVKDDLVAPTFREESAKKLLEAHARTLIEKLKAGAKVQDIVNERQPESPSTLTADQPKADPKDKKADPYGAGWVEAGPITRGGRYFAGIGLSENAADIAFALTEASPVSDKLIDSGRKFYVAVLKKHEQPDMEAYAKAKGQISSSMAYFRRQEAAKNFKKRLRDAANVDINPEILVYRDTSAQM